MKKILVLYCFCLLSVSVVCAVTKEEADKSYSQEKYGQAVQQYELLLKQGENAGIYYNLGNAYYRMHDIAHAVLNYERAALRDPGNSDIRFNLALARSKTQDKIVDTDQFFVLYWCHSLVNAHSTDGWGRMALGAFFLLLVACLLARFLEKPLLRRLATYLAVLLLVLVIVFNVCAAVQRSQFLDKTGAIIMKTAPIKSTPANSGNMLFTLHPGTKVKITDDTMEKWKEITLPDGKKGWISSSSMELI